MNKLISYCEGFLLLSHNVYVMIYSLIGTSVSQAFPRQTLQYEHLQTPSSDQFVVKTITLFVVNTFTRHQSVFIQPDLKVCRQLDFPMLKDVVQVAPTREKPSPGSARRDQTLQTRHKGRREGVD